ncbi:ABC transporter permease [Nonomuraea africana]|uniref:ABC-2 type transport system permease protein n=1 Tax=Nonomuraea africana TaxID=46171 RepID=A0ABR9KA98_9ACTN|nr:ABC transporter permease subunit [Nonomuraea africana]MBE1558933.1 ABC-2 type transport system permease protein [Nonomuraea africana]
MSKAEPEVRDLEAHEGSSARDGSFARGGFEARSGSEAGGAGVRRTPGLVPVAESRLTAEHGPRADLPALPATPQDGGTGPARAFLRMLGSELGLTFRRPRNVAMLTVLAAVPVVLGIVLRLVGGDMSDGPGGIIQQVTGNGFFLAFISLSALVPLLMPVAIAVVAADAVAGEASGGTLRYLLAAPAGRTRLLAVKYVNAVLFCLAVASAVSLAALVTGLILFPSGPVTLLSGVVIPLGDALLRMLIVVGYVTAGMAALAAVALALSTLTEAPIGAIAATVVMVIVTQVLRVIPELDGLQPYLLPNWWSDFDAVLRDPIAFDDLRSGLLAFGAYILLFGSFAWARFTSKDITS